MSSLQMPFGNPNAVISPNYCAPQPFQLSMKKKHYFLSSREYEVKDDKYGRFLFKVKRINSFFSSKVVIYDAVGNPIVTLRPKVNSRRSRWQVFRGESKANTDIIFSARISSSFQFNRNLDVFLQNNIGEKICDFKMKASNSANTCDIYGPSSLLIAQMKRKGIFFGRNHFMVSVKPNVDYAFIVALIVILDEIVNSD
ncbi:PREDICTED: protein LURP-one-related 15-like isoform X2 [Ipomoea nil]|uniref:protein LURP-one-related 15-like isoform X2 n=1 Tax=Ipomoea nil TaxID=35883 RepID=UPI000901A10F|nr:PREDICTED: protein LURP-one-related 15-like isoform X2 [Ipomoea nil]